VKRVLEPEIMDDEQQVLAYTNADFADSNQRFVDLLFQEYQGKLKNILDIGCGPADVPIRIIHKDPNIKITAIDASGQMIRQAKQAVKKNGFEQNIDALLGRVPGLKLNKYSFDTIISKDFLHHLPDPALFWEELKRLVQLNRQATGIFIMDLFRPKSKEKGKQIVEAVSKDEADILKNDFYYSLLASFSIDEIQDQLKEAKMNLKVDKVSERHMVIKGLLHYRQKK
jgi:ubiquinone/menaquinone biosynthesis C-methylase UbiE